MPLWQSGDGYASPSALVQPQEHDSGCCLPAARVTSDFLHLRLTAIHNFLVTIQELDIYISRHILTNFKRYHDIDGAPFQLGDDVRVLDNPSNDDTFDASFSDKLGVVTYFEYDCGCGQTYPFDPMIGVKFEDEGIEEFWKEELMVEPEASGSYLDQ